MDFKEYNLSVFSIRFFKQNFARLLDESDDELRYALIIAIYRYMVEAEKNGNIKMKGENFSISMQSDKALMKKIETAIAFGNSNPNNLHWSIYKHQKKNMTKRCQRKD